MIRDAFEKFINLFRSDEVYRLNRADAEKTLANVFADANKEPNSRTFDELLPEGRRRSRSTALFAGILTAVGAVALLILLLVLLGGCGADAAVRTGPDGEEEAGSALLTGIGTRDHTPVCLIPTAAGEVVYGNELAQIDASNSAEGYVIVSYSGDCPKVKLQITGPNDVTYTFNCKGGGEQEVFPLSSGDGDYLIAVYENIEGSQYASAFSTAMTVVMSDENRPFLYPNQYVMFD